VYERAVGERQERLGGLAFGLRVPVEAVLVDGVAELDLGRGVPVSCVRIPGRG